MGFDTFSGLGDSSIDVQYGTTTKSGFLWSVGASSSIPTASKDELGNDLWTVGPGFQVGKITKNTVFGTFINHQRDVAGSNDEQEVNLTTVQVFGVYLPGGGWSVASSPIMNYDHGTDQWTIPTSLAAGKTFKFNGKGEYVLFAI